MAGNRRHIPRSTKEHMVILSGYMTSRKITEVCDVSHCTVNWVKRLSLDTGSVVCEPLQPGRPQTLNSLDAMVSCCLHMLIHALMLSSFLKAVSNTPQTCTYQSSGTNYGKLQESWGIWVHNFSNIAKARICKKEGKFYIVATSVDNDHLMKRRTQNMSFSISSCSIVNLLHQGLNIGWEWVE